MDPAGDQASSRSVAEAIARALREGALATLATLVKTPRQQGVGAKLLIDESGVCVGSLGDPALDSAVAAHAYAFRTMRAEAQTFRVEEFAPRLEAWHGARVLFERIEAEPQLVVCGAGHVGASLSHLAHAIGYRVTLIDDRADFVTRERFPQEGIKLIAALDGWEAAVRAAVSAGRGMSVAVVTRGHHEDEECMRAVLAARPDYVGLIGSKRRTNIVLERLRETGADDTRLREVRAPIGLDIGARTPEEVALAILAEIVAERRGGKGLPLSAWRRA